MLKRLAAVLSMTALGLTILGYGVAVAARPNAFQASVEVAVVAPGSVTPAGHRITTEGEVIAGTVISSPQWGDLEGASFMTRHSSNTAIDFSTGDILSGHGHGTAQLTKVDSAGNVSILEVNYEASISGNIYTGVQDSAKWNVVRATGIFQAVQAHGAIDGVIAPIQMDGYWTLGGVLTFSGVFG